MLYLLSDLCMRAAQYVLETGWSLRHRSILRLHPQFTGRVAGFGTGWVVGTKWEYDILQ